MTGAASAGASGDRPRSAARAVQAVSTEESAIAVRTSSTRSDGFMRTMMGTLTRSGESALVMMPIGPANDRARHSVSSAPFQIPTGRPRVWGCS
jgi:hypothetical protein